jgi:hypothetical protein
VEQDFPKAIHFAENAAKSKNETLSTRPFTVQNSLRLSSLELKPVLQALGNWGDKWLPEFDDNKNAHQCAPVAQEDPTNDDAAASENFSQPGFGQNSNMEFSASSNYQNTNTMESMQHP